MQRFLGSFLSIIAIYHIIVTVLGYGILGGDSQVLISIARDALWIFFVAYIFFANLKNIKKYWKIWNKARMFFAILIIFSIGISFWKGQSLNNIMIGIKYGFFYLFIFLSASFVGFTSLKKLDIKHINWIQYFLILIVIFGFIWQILKIIKPELFMNIGYGKFDDFYFGANPPIYYLTGFEGTTRWQGIFAGPNNYGYFLVAFLPLILLWFKGKTNKISDIIKNPFAHINILVILLWILAIVMTLSRAAILGMVLIFVLLSKDRIKRNKKISIIGLVALVIGIGALSYLKSSSTIGHIQAKMSYVNEIVSNPLGHGLGNSGPAVHHQGTMLPENYFMQIMLDIGTVGFLLWAAVIFQILIIFKKLEFRVQNSEQEKRNSKLGTMNSELVLLHWKRLYLGRTILLFVGLFLHVFEDSMVNYIFFICFGLISGYMTNLQKIENEK